MAKKIMKIFLKVLFFLLLIGIAVGLIYIGVYYSKISKKDYIFGKMIDSVFDKTERIFKIDSDYYIGDTFTIDGTFKSTLSSEEYTNKSVNDIEYKKKNNILNNMSKMDVTYTIKHDKKKGQIYAELNENIGTESIFSGKYLIDNSTEYLFINGVVSEYVNNGANNYYEAFTEETTTIDNVSYLYNFIRDSIKNNISEDELNGYDVETLIGDNTVKVAQVSYRVTDKSYKKLLKGILKDIKGDDRAREILSSCVDVDNLKVNEKKKYLKGNESYTINIYVSKPFLKPVKYEVIYLKDDQKNIYTYEGDMDNGLFYYSENNEIKYRATYTSTSKKIDVMVYDKFNKEIGTIKAQKDKNNLMLTMTVDLDEKKYDITYSAKNKELKKKSFTRENQLTFKIMDQMVTKIQGDILLESKIENKVRIMEDTSNSVLRSSITDEENDKIEKIRDTIKERLER